MAEKLASDRHIPSDSLATDPGRLDAVTDRYWMEGAPKAITANEIPGLVWICLLNTAFAYWAFSRSIKRIGPDSMAMISMLNLSLPSHWIWLVNESLGLYQWIGIGLVLLSLLLMMKVKRKAKRTAHYSPALKPL